MIRILHTADWHVGQTLRGFSRVTQNGPENRYQTCTTASSKSPSRILGTTT
jgi:hypothetical protein